MSRSLGEIFDSIKLRQNFMGEQMGSLTRTQLTKLIISICLIICTGIILAARIRLTPTQFPIGVGLIVIAIVFVGISHFLKTRQYVPILLSSIIIFSLLAAIIAPSPENNLIAYDSHATLFHVQWIDDTGTILTEHTGVRGGGRGSIYPALYSLGAIWVGITGIESELGLSILPLFLLPWLPLLLYLSSNSRWEIVSVLGVIPSFYVFFATAPTAQMVALPLVLSAFVLLLKLNSSIYKWRILLLFIIILLSLSVTHTYTAVVAVGAVMGFALVPGRFTFNRLLIPLLSGIVVVGVWVSRETSSMLARAAGIIVLLLTGFSFEEQPTPLGLLPNHPKEIEIIGITRFFPDWIAFGVRVTFFLLLGCIFIYLGGWALARIHPDIWSAEICLFGIGSISALLFSYMVADINFSRFWVIAMLFAPPAITSLKARMTIPKQQIFAVCVIILIISQSFAIPPAIFSDEVNPQSYTDGGRPVYHTSVEYAAGEFIDRHEIEPVSSDMRMYFIEPRYQQNVLLLSDCYVNSCSSSYVFWHDRYKKEWITSDGYGKFPNSEVKLETNREAIYSTGEVTLYS